MKSSNIGGQAVLEGIMMRNGGKYSVAVRRTDGEIAVDVQDYKSVIPWKTPLKIPFIRGIFNFVDSLVLGMKTLTYSASFFEEDEEEVLTEEEAAQKREGGQAAHEPDSCRSSGHCGGDLYGPALFPEQYRGKIYILSHAHDGV